MKSLAIDIGVLSVCVVAIITQWMRRRRSRLPLPPSPDGLPLLGNLLQIPKDDAWVTYHEWCEQLGTDILHVNAAGTSMIVVDTIEVATDLLEKRSSLYSSRLRLTMAGELMGWNFLLGLTPHGKGPPQSYPTIQLSSQPRPYLASKEAFNATVLPSRRRVEFQPYELKATRNLLRRLLDGTAPTDVLQELRQMAGETIMKVTYGLDVQEKKDPYIEAADEALHGLSVATVPGAFLVDVIPALKYIPRWFPGASFQKKASAWKRLTECMLKLPFEDGTAKLDAGEGAYSFLSNALRQEGLSDSPEHAYDVQAATGTMYTAGSDTTVSAIGTAILGLLENPDVVKKAQKQLDEVVGQHRLPTFDDYKNLPYITAIAKEASRWKVVTPMAIPHMVDADDEYQGYRIPKGSIVVPNAWAMLHNPKAYPDPFTFNPDRFMDGEELDPKVQDPAQVAFGFGRRICPGRYVAIHAVWIALASILAVFDLKKAVDEGGNEIPLTHEYRSGLITIPEAFLCSFQIRSKEAEDLVRATAMQI